MEKRRLVLVGVQSKDLQKQIRDHFDRHISGSVLFAARDGTDLLIKASRTRPHLVIFSYDLQKTSAVDVYNSLKANFPREQMAFLYLGPELPTVMKDDHSLGTLAWEPSQSMDEISKGIAHALNSLGEMTSEFKVKHLAKGEVLIKEGDDPEFLYFVIRGSLKASTYQDPKTVDLGVIGAGEFVGEMAVISADKRNATVLADDACELLEIPARDFNRAVLTKPSWAKALMATLTRRLKIMNSLTKRV